MIPSSRPKSNLYPWCVVRQLPNMQQIVVARFHHRSNADGYLDVINRLLSDAPHLIVYDAEQDDRSVGQSR